MKRLLLFLVVVVCVVLVIDGAQAAQKKMIPRYNTVTKQWASYPLVTIKDIQEVPHDSLVVADGIQNVAARWTLQTSPYMNDTVTVIGLVVAPAKTLTYTGKGWTMLLYDTSASIVEWGGILVRVNYAVDSSQAELDGFLAPDRGDVIMITGLVTEFPTSSMNSVTQFQPVAGISINILGSLPIPAPVHMNVTDFYSGIPMTGDVQYSTGEMYEGREVEFTNLTVDALINTVRGTFRINDGFGNANCEYDASKYFTLAGGTTDHPGPDSIWTIEYPPVGATVDTIRGVILTSSGTENNDGYRICPIYYGDVKFGISLPTVIGHRRYPVTVTSNDTVKIDATVRQTVGGYPIRRAVLLKSINNGPWEADTMTMITIDSTYEATILDFEGNPLPVGTNVRYFIKGLDDHGNEKIYANSSSSVGGDTSKGFFFYDVIDRPFTIHDVQYTPYVNGRSPYLGGWVSISGIVTADTTDLPTTLRTQSGGTPSWFIQDGNTPWSGIWVVARDSASNAALCALHRGDSVTVYGSVQEQYDVTRIYDSLVTVHASGRPEPAPVTVLANSIAGHGNGDPSAEQYEGMLVRIVNGTITSVNPQYNDIWEWWDEDASGMPIFVCGDGWNSYSNIEADSALGKTHILHVGDPVDTVIGIVCYSYGNYKIEPRGDDDFVVGTPYTYNKGWNMVSIPRLQTPSSQYDATAVYPGASGHVFYYDGSYKSTSVLKNGMGYWVKFPAVTMIRQLGLKLVDDTIDVTAGWNLIGALGDSMLTSTVVTVPDTMHLSQFFGYSGAYRVATTLMPTQGYWVKASEPGQIILQSSGIVPRLSGQSIAINECNTLTVSNKDGNSQVLYFGLDRDGKARMSDYEMPPGAPEASLFDARYASGRILAAYPRNMPSPMQFTIAINAGKSPLTLEWNVVRQDGKHFVLSDGVDGQLMKPTELVGHGSVELTKTGTYTLYLTVTNGPAIPKEFSLSQNYPNPFNPTTRFDIGVPQTAHVQVAVYNLLGQRVAMLVDEMREAGYYTVTWNGHSQDGNPVASGIYFVRMSGGEKFNAVRKLVMMK